MTLEERIILFSTLGEYIKENRASDEFISVFQLAKSKNPWFTQDNIIKALEGICDTFLKFDKLNHFVNTYSREYFNPKSPKKVGVVAAGNIPLVGFQDVLHVVLSGHIAHVKPSSQDEVLMTFIIKILHELNVASVDFIKLSDKLNDMDAYIATGSGNTSRYFEYYFGSKPHVIRKNRISVAILTGEESKTQLSDLGNDIFSFFGLGCRNVSKIYVPKGYDFVNFFESIEYWNSITLHSKYVNNYDYNKSILLVNGDKHLDNGFLLLKDTKEMHSPISAAFYEEYDSLEEVNAHLNSQKDSLQCVVGSDMDVKFGKTQSPELSDFADDVDTISFLKTLEEV